MTRNQIDRHIKYLETFGMLCSEVFGSRKSAEKFRDIVHGGDIAVINYLMECAQDFEKQNKDENWEEKDFYVEIGNYIADKLASPAGLNQKKFTMDNIIEQIEKSFQPYSIDLKSIGKTLHIKADECFIDEIGMNRWSSKLFNGINYEDIMHVYNECKYDLQELLDIVCYKDTVYPSKEVLLSVAGEHNNLVRISTSDLSKLLFTDGTEQNFYSDEIAMNIDINHSYYVPADVIDKTDSEIISYINKYIDEEVGEPIDED